VENHFKIKILLISTCILLIFLVSLAMDAKNVMFRYLYFYIFSHILLSLWFGHISEFQIAWLNTSGRDAYKERCEAFLIFSRRKWRKRTFLVGAKKTTCVCDDLTAGVIYPPRLRLVIHSHKTTVYCILWCLMWGCMGE
jgi:hypothetical protein